MLIFHDDEPFRPTERCLSGLKSTLGKRVCVTSVPGVRIPLSPPFDAFLSSFVLLLMASHPESLPPTSISFKEVECPEPVEGLSFVYILICSNGSFYVGMSDDVKKRLFLHAQGFGARHTRQMKQFKLVYTEGPMERESATRRERQLKKWSRAKKTALITGDIEQLKQLSKSKN
jgi:putative endonuclease